MMIKGAIAALAAIWLVSAPVVAQAAPADLQQAYGRIVGDNDLSGHCEHANANRRALANAAWTSRRAVLRALCVAYEVS